MASSNEILGIMRQIEQFRSTTPSMLYILVIHVAISGRATRRNPVQRQSMMLGEAKKTIDKKKAKPNEKKSLLQVYPGVSRPGKQHVLAVSGLGILKLSVQ